MAITGKMWAHEHWGHEKAPDIVTFAKKMLIGGYYYSDDIRWNTVRNKNFFRGTRGYTAQFPQNPHMLASYWVWAVTVMLYQEACFLVLMFGHLKY